VLHDNAASGILSSTAAFNSQHVLTMQKLQQGVPYSYTSDKSRYVDLLPRRPYCTNRIGPEPLMRRSDLAVKYKHLQFNPPGIIRWMVFDIDQPESFFAHEDRGCPPPTYISLNRANGHGHAGYLLESPVFTGTGHNETAVRFFEDVQRGMTNRMGADTSYPHFLTKCPLSTEWETAWIATRPHRLDTLNDCLDKNDKRRTVKFEQTAVGRNVALFDAVRSYAYKNTIKAKKSGISLQSFQSTLESVAGGVNADFAIPLTTAEVRGICRSVTKWVWNEFTPVKFSQIQSQRRMKGVDVAKTLKLTQPWVALGISQATWYRRRGTGCIS